MPKLILILFVFMCAQASSIHSSSLKRIINGVEFIVITNEVEVPAYELPDVLTIPDGTVITTAEEWRQLARPALIAEFERVAYGVTPKLPVYFFFNDSIDDVDKPRPTDGIVVVVENESTQEIFNGKALMRQARLSFSKGDKTASFELLLVLPLKSKEPAPVFVGLNFWGNHTVHPMTSIRKAREVPGMEVKERGSHAERWNLEKLIDAGYAVATAFRGEIVPEDREHFNTGILNLFADSQETPRMGAIGAWAWSLSRILDYLQSIPEIDCKRATVIGHSRLGKTALWAGAQDERFSRVIANNSGCMGAALSRRCFGETIEIITRNFPYWFSPELTQYGNNENALPIDQHQLLALIAPRPLRLGSAETDWWADIRGEHLALREAQKVYQLFGIEEQLPKELPSVDASQGRHLRFHIRAGKHNITPQDWDFYLKP